MNGLANEPKRVRIDPETLEELEIVLQSRLGGRVRNFHLEWCENGLVLRGQACTYYAKQKAQQAVMELTNLPILINAIEVI